MFLDQRPLFSWNCFLINQSKPNPTPRMRGQWSLDRNVVYAETEVQSRKMCTSCLAIALNANSRDAPLESPACAPTNTYDHHKWGCLPLLWLLSKCTCLFYSCGAESSLSCSAVWACGVFSFLARSSLCFSWYLFHCISKSCFPLFIWSCGEVCKVTRFQKIDKGYHV